MSKYKKIKKLCKYKLYFVRLDCHVHLIYYVELKNKFFNLNMIIINYSVIYLNMKI